MLSEPTIVKIKELNPDMINPSTEKMYEPDFSGSKIVIIGKPGCFTPGTKILMYNGEIKNVENVKVGEQVMGDDSTSRNVLELCHNEDEMFEIIPTNGKSYTVNKQHKLVLYSKRHDEVYELTVEDFLNRSQYFRTDTQIFRTAVEFPKKTVKVVPYSCGLLIGRINYKRIPTEYKINSREVRLQLLAGILDVIGVKTENGYSFKVKNNEELLEDILFVVNSLGFTVDMKDNTYFVYGDNMENIPVRVLRKTFNSKPINNLFQDFTVKPVGHGEYYGFTLDGNRRFLLSTFDVVRNTGKSTLIAGLLYSKRHIFPVGIAFSGTEDSNGFFKKIMPSTFIYNEYSPEKIELFIKRQKIAKKHVENPWAVIIIDDCTDDPKILSTPLQQGLFKRGRHWACLYILSLQYAMDIKPAIRTNIDGCFVLREPSIKIRKVLWENYASIIPDFNLFCQIMDGITDNFTALYIHNQTRTNDWHECVYYYKAPLTPEDFKFGAPEYWQFHEDRKDPDYVDSFE